MSPQILLWIYVCGPNTKQARGRFTRWLDLKLWSVRDGRRIRADQGSYIPIFVNVVFIQI